MDAATNTELKQLWMAVEALSIANGVTDADGVLRIRESVKCRTAEPPQPFRGILPNSFTLDVVEPKPFLSLCEPLFGRSTAPTHRLHIILGDTPSAGVAFGEGELSIWHVLFCCLPKPL